MRFQIEDTNYDWEPGAHVVQITSVEERDSVHGREVLWTFCEPGVPNHRVTGMTSLSCSPMGKLVRWFLAATGHKLPAVQNNELDTDDAIECLATVKIEMRDGEHGPRSFVVDVQPAPPDAAAAVTPPAEPPEEVPF